MLTIWIVHRDAKHRAALTRMVGAGDGTILGGPMDPIFQSATPPNVVLLGLSGDFEEELDFVQRFGNHWPEAAWILLTSPQDRTDSQRLFDTLKATHLSYPPDPLELRRAVRVGLRKRRIEPLSSRSTRKGLGQKFRRWFKNIELPELGRSLDPRLSQVSVLIRGERGTGRSLLARYIHAFGGRANADFITIPTEGILSAEGLLGRISAIAQTTQSDSAVLWLEEADQLPVHVQRTLRDWVEFGLPPGSTHFLSLRWIAGAGPETDFDREPGLDLQLTEVLSALSMQVPALRDRHGHIPELISEAAQVWCQKHGETTRHFSPESLDLLSSYPWPGNLHELESVVGRSLAFSAADPMQPIHLRFPSDSHWLDRLEGEIEPNQSLRSEPEPLETYETLSEATLIEENEAIIMGEPVLEPETITEEPHTPVEEPLAAEEVVPEPTLSGFRSTANEKTEADPNESEPSDFRRLVNAVAHEVRNPLVSIRTFSELLPEQYEDPEFRDQFSQLVRQDVNRIDAAVSRLQNMVELPAIQSESVDMAHLLDKLLEEHNDQIRERRLLILKELDHRSPHVVGDPLLLRDAFSGLLTRTLNQVSDGGDVYIASKHSDSRLGASPSLRVLLRYAVSHPEALNPRASHEDLDGIMAQTIIQSLGGRFTLDTTDGEECVIVIDLPAPATD
ncbi:MAG: hypothetical protein CL917_04455 [Deltaproteobacteria bacterium]|nr:hypothetical protein [Deltaproteobacteria bacterium]